MSMNLQVIHHIHGEVNVRQTPTTVTYKIVDSLDKKKKGTTLSGSRRLDGMMTS